MYLFQTKDRFNKQALLEGMGIHNKLNGPDSKNRLAPCFPLIIDADGKINYYAFRFLLNFQQTDRSRDCRKTLQTYSESLVSWFRYLSKEDFDWRRPMPIFLSNYRYALANGCGHTEKCCASTTINLRSVVVKEFYRYLILKDSECSLDSEFERDHELDYFLIKKFVNVASRIRATHKSKKRGRALTEDQINRILNYLPLPHSLIFKWTLATGLRRSNAVDLNLDQLPKNNLSINFIEIKVKGGKLISIPVTSALLDMTMDYIYTKRAILSSRNPRSTNKVFLGRGGFAITSNAYYRAFDRACRRAAIKASPHMARHTFAARAYSVLEKLALDGYPVNPIKLLQSWLGHNQAETTEIYLDSIAALDRPIIDGLLHVQKMAIT